VLGGLPLQKKKTPKLIVREKMKYGISLIRTINGGRLCDSIKKTGRGKGKSGAGTREKSTSSIKIEDPICGKGKLDRASQKKGGRKIFLGGKNGQVSDGHFHDHVTVLF